MNQLVFLLEERSMKTLLEGLLPRLMPGLPFICIPHEGKKDLEKSIPRKLRAWRDPGTRFVIVRDNDGGDCHLLKTRLEALAHEAKRADVLVRIACQELEARYFGEPAAMAKAFGNDRLKEIIHKAQYRDPYAVEKPSRELAKLIPEFRSFQNTMDGVERLYASCLSDAI
ncbi:MAG: cytoplasmic protein [Pseudomonadota bacterium]